MTFFHSQPVFSCLESSLSRLLGRLWDLGSRALKRRKRERGGTRSDNGKAMIFNIPVVHGKKEAYSGTFSVSITKKKEQQKLHEIEP